MNNLAGEVKAFARSFKCVLEMADKLEQIGDVDSYIAEQKTKADAQFEALKAAEQVRTKAEEAMGRAVDAVASARADAVAILNQAQEQAQEIIAKAHATADSIAADARRIEESHAAGAKAAVAARRKEELKLLEVTAALAAVQADMDNIRAAAARMAR